MSRPKLLDLFCGAGGCSVGYQRAGFDVMGVDIEAHPDYPFDLTVADAMEYLATADLSTFDVIHASPPCPRYSVATKATGTSDSHPDLVPPVRDALNAWGGVWVMENVLGAPMPDAIMVCGWAVGIPMRRHRLFDSSAFLLSPGCACPDDIGLTVFGHESSVRIDGRRVQIPPVETRRRMGLEWMTSRDDVADAIPPAYTEFVGAQLIAHLERVAA